MNLLAGLNQRLQISSLSASFSALERGGYPARAGPFSGAPFPDLKRAVPEIRPATLCLHRQFHTLSVHQNHVLETSGNAAGFRTKFAPKRVDKAYGSI
jgi:hypothetical protein